MSEYRFVSFVPVVGQHPPRGTLYRYKNRDEDDDFDLYTSGDEVDEYEIRDFEFIRPADSESPVEQVPATIEATTGVSVRELFAVAAMHRYCRDWPAETTARFAVEYADALIAELAKPKVNE